MILEESRLKPGLRTIDDGELATIRRDLAREPSPAELAIYSALWSEHCSYKHTRRLLATLPTTGPGVLCGPGENAGAIDIGDGWAVVFKIESHNHPTAVEPHQGAATGVGGILRDVVAMGARPIALLDSLRFGSLDDSRQKRRALEAIRGIADYGNSVGVPVVGGEFDADAAFAENCLLNVMAIGLARSDALASSRARGAGNVLLYYGNATGRDGVNGAAFASVDLSEDSVADRSCVQVADPFAGRCAIEATLELLASGVVVALQDMGAAGLTCAAAEMAWRGGLGVRLDLDRVPQRAADLSAAEILVSESQERFLAVIAREDFERASAVLARHGLKGCIVGELNSTGRFVAEHHGAVAADVPLESLCNGVPEPVSSRGGRAPRPRVRDWRTFDYSRINWMDLLDRALASPRFASKQWIYDQFDHDVQTNTLVGPGSGAGVIRLRDAGRCIAATVDGIPIWCALDPREGTKRLVAEAAANLVAMGARPLAVTNNLNFGNPNAPEVARQVEEVIAGLGEACRALGLPVTGGNVSLYNQSSLGAIPPTPVIGMIGLIENPKHITRARFAHPGDAIVLVGPRATHAGGSRLLRDLAGELVGPAIGCDLEVVKRVDEAVLNAIASGFVTAANDVSDGGLLLALADMAVATWDPLIHFGEMMGPREVSPPLHLVHDEEGSLNYLRAEAAAPVLGARVAMPPDECTVETLISEEAGRFILTCRPEHEAALLSIFGERAVLARRVGNVMEGRFAIHEILEPATPLEMSVAALQGMWERAW